jgi:endonuclease/exonuclease/phosphatase family metal-dependent hydrolase
VASYNVRCASCYEGGPNELTWYERRDAVAENIKKQSPDVIGIQEASQGWLRDEVGNPISPYSQFDDLLSRLGTPYKITNGRRNNCEREWTPTNCIIKDQGASQGTKIIYDSSKLLLLQEGSQKLTELRAADNDRYVAWAIFAEIETGRQFFFANTHLEHTKDVAGDNTWFNLRVLQTNELVAAIKANNPDNLPTFVVGDFNSTKVTKPANGPYDAMVAAGFIDPLGNTYKSTTKAPGATVTKRIRTNFASFNGFNAKAPVSKNVNGNYMDYIWTTPGIRVAEWETVMNIDSAGKYIGIIPSDHNMIRATVFLPS